MKDEIFKDACVAAWNSRTDFSIFDADDRKKMGFSGRGDIGQGVL